VIDRETLLENFMDDEELLFESIDTFLTSAAARSVSLDAAVAAADAEKVMHEGHTLKGMVGIFSTGEAFEAAKKLEFMGRNNDLNGSVEALADFKAKLNELCVYLEAWKNEG
jgi:HPt (histidine-containing phosphotransfer) domain-containing protein